MPVPVTQKAETPLVEIFSSLQGEGTLVGYRQIFIRFAGCHLDCNYCDTDFTPSGNCLVETVPGSGSFKQVANPLNLESVIDIISPWVKAAPSAYHSISLTGGEPLLHDVLLAEWLPALRQLMPIYLETSGTQPERLAPLLPYIDWVSMDIKLESLTGKPTDWDAHQRFLKLAAQTNCYVKMVVAEVTSAEEIQRGAEMVAEVPQQIPLILQPVTMDEQVAVSTKCLLQFQELAATIHSDVRVIPQTHRFLGVL